MSKNKLHFEGMEADDLDLYFCWEMMFVPLYNTEHCYYEHNENIKIHEWDVWGRDEISLDIVYSWIARELDEYYANG